MSGSWTPLFKRRCNKPISPELAPRAKNMAALAWRLGSLVLLAAVSALCVQEREVHARWEDLPKLVEGREVETVLTNGVHLRGKALKVLADGLQVRVKETSDPALIPRGSVVVPRELLTVLTITQKRRVARAVLTVTTFVGAPYVLALFNTGADELGTSGVYAIATGFAGAGYLLGDWIDGKNASRLRVVLALSPRPQAGGSGLQASSDKGKSDETD